jgi:hypothetical protein
MSYGVVMQFYDETIIPSDNWEYIFLVDLPSKQFEEEQNFIKLLQTNSRNNMVEQFCTQADATHKSAIKSNNQATSHIQSLVYQHTNCYRFQSHTNFLLQMVNNTYTTMHTLIDDILAIVPIDLPMPAQTNRQSRAIFGFLGSAISSLTGLATQDDLNKVSELLVRASVYFDKMFNITRKSIKDNSILVKVANDRIDALISKVNNNSLRTLQLLEQVERESMIQVDYLGNITLTKFKFLFNAQELIDYYSNVLEAMEILRSGRLPSFIFTQKVLTDMLETVKLEIAKEYGRGTFYLSKYVIFMKLEFHGTP